MHAKVITGGICATGKNLDFSSSLMRKLIQSPNICWENQEEAEVFICQRKWEGSEAAAVTLSEHGPCTRPCWDSHPVALAEQEAISPEPSVLPVPMLH